MTHSESTNVVASKGIDVIVVNYRTVTDLDDFLDSVRKYAPNVPMSIHVVDVSPLPEQKRPNLANFTECSYTRVKKNIGYARAVNMAAAKSSKEVLAIFNADVVLSEGALDGCYQALTTNDRWGVLGPLQINDRGRVTHAGIFGTNVDPRHRAWLRQVDDSVRDVAEAITVSGSAYFIKRHVWQELLDCPVYRQLFPYAEGAFLPTQFYYEETGCSYHAREHGWKVMYFGEVEIIHKWHAAVKTHDMERQAVQWMRESKVVFEQFCDQHGIDHD